MKHVILGIITLLVVGDLVSQAQYFAKDDGSLVNMAGAPAAALIHTNGNESFDKITTIRAWVDGSDPGNETTIVLDNIYGNILSNAPHSLLLKPVINKSWNYISNQLFHNPMGEQKIKFTVSDGQGAISNTIEGTIRQYSLGYPPVFSDSSIGQSSQKTGSSANFNGTTRGNGTQITGALTFNPNIIDRYYPYNTPNGSGFIPGLSFRAADCKVRITAQNAANSYNSTEDVALTEVNANSATLTYQLPFPPANKVPVGQNQYEVNYVVELLRKKSNGTYEGYPMNNEGTSLKLNNTSLIYNWEIPSSYIADSGHIWSGFTPLATWQSSFPKLIKYQNVNAVDASGAVVYDGSYSAWTKTPGNGFGFQILYDLARYWQIPYDASNFKIDLSTSGNQANQLKFIYAVNNMVIAQGTTLTLSPDLLTLATPHFNGSGSPYLQVNYNNRITLTDGVPLEQDADGGIGIIDGESNGVFIIPTHYNTGTQKAASSVNKYFGPGNQIIYTETYYTRAVETNITITITYNIAMKSGEIRNFGKTLTIPCTFTYGVETLYQGSGGF